MAPQQPPAKKALFGGGAGPAGALMTPVRDCCPRGRNRALPAAASSQVTQVMSYRDGA